MRILFDNVNFSSNSGPNAFGRKLKNAFKSTPGIDVITNPDMPHDICLSFIERRYMSYEKRFLRLDGVYFNIDQNWKSLNSNIQKSFNTSHKVIYQTNFNKSLCETFLGKHERSCIIPNGTDLAEIASLPVFNMMPGKCSEYWCSAASWRPHKRLEQNIKYFLECAPKDAGLIILGSFGYKPNLKGINTDRVFFLGEQDWATTVKIYKACKKFIHLAFFDHCPNVVIDARAAGCEIVVASSGGTKEIAGKGAIIVKDSLEVISEPIKLYEPPNLNFSDFYLNEIDSLIDIKSISQKYIDEFDISL